MSNDDSSQSIIELSGINTSSTSTSMTNELLFEQLDKIDEKNASTNYENKRSYSICIENEFRRI